MSRSVGIVVPAFRPDLERLERYVRAIDDRLEPAAIRIELDDPVPETVEQLEDVPATVHATEQRRGKGAAITDGFRALETDVLAFVDADGSTPPASVESVVDVVESQRADLALGTRRHSDADVRSDQSLKRRLLGGAFAWLARRLLAVSVTDYQCGAKALDRAVWDDVEPHLEETGFAWDGDLLAFAHACGYRLEEVPITWEDADSSTVSSVGTTLELASGLVRTRHRVKRFEGSWFHTRISSDKPGAEPIADGCRGEHHDD